MKNVKSISLKQALVGASVEFLTQEEMACLKTQESIPELISQLLYYKEEGKPLYPEIYIFDNIDIVRKILPTSQICYIGKGEKSKATMLKALKKCAPLTENGWVIFILRKEDEFEYGVLRAGTSVLSVSISETLIDNGTLDVKAVLVHQLAEKLIEVKGVKADSLLICYGGSDVFEKSPIDNQIKFIESIAEAIPENIREQATNFFRKIFLEVLQKGHGTLACVIDHKKKELPVKLQDGIKLQDRIDIPAAIEELLHKNDLQANSLLDGQFSLITGMMQSDGITVFTDRGEVVAYNVFVKHPESILKETTTGGARSRTFLTLCNFINNGLKSAYIQSQDGKIEFRNGRE
jgi:hypothetical protein